MPVIPGSPPDCFHINGLTRDCEQCQNPCILLDERAGVEFWQCRKCAHLHLVVRPPVTVITER